MSVCEITNPRSFDEFGNPTENGINDLRMGSTDKKLSCKTCGCNSAQCPGHFGFIRLAKPVFHVGFISECLKILKCVCYSCSRILIDDLDKYEEIKKIQNPKTRQLRIYNYCKLKKDIRCNDRKRKGNNNYNIHDNQEIRQNDDNDENDINKGCGKLRPEYIRDKDNCLKIKVEFKDENRMELEDNNRELRPEEVLQIFSRISDDECRMLGFEPEYARPEWMIIQNLAVCPPQVRPSVSVDSSLRSQDDLTHQYNQILKINKDLLTEKVSKGTNTTLASKFDTLQYNVATLMNNELGTARALKKSGQPIKALYARLKGKEGRVRGNLMGKRVDFSARSVISPDPNLQVDELGVPKSIAMNLTFPETVTDMNIDRLKKLVNNGPGKWPGAKMIKSNDGKTVIDLRYCKNTTDEHLEKGYIVERHMQDGDYVIFNRQPSLHKMSMMGHRVHILPYSTFRLNLSVTTPYNADFDGDEMNMHLPQNLESKSEIMNIMHVPKQIVSPQSNRPVMGIVQDTLIGCKLFTARDNFMTFEQIMNLVFMIDDFDIKNLPMPCIMKPQPLWSGKQIFSLILPEKINLIRKREDTPKEFEGKLNLIDNFVQITKGELIQGIICKKTVGASTGGIVHCIWTEESPDKTIKFLSNCQKLINNWLLLSGWTVGISDIICDPETSQGISEILRKMKGEIEKLLIKAQIGKLDCQPGKNMVDTFEFQANGELNNARGEAGKLVEKALGPRNHLKNMVSAGSKGNKTNISQIIAFVGQQNVEGQRVPFNFNRRTLPHFLKDDYKSESKGFVENSFLKGLTPQEFYFHAMGGREGIIDTAVKTSQTGYIQRRLVKALEDIMIKYDGTVRNSLGQIMQFLYGEDGMAGEYIEDQKFLTLEMDDQTLIKNYKFIEIDDNDEILANLRTELLRFMEETVVNEIMNEENEDLNQLRIELNEEFEQIKRDRDEIRKTVLNKGDSFIYIPVNIPRILRNAETLFNINLFSKSDLNPIIVHKKVQELKNQLKIIEGDDIISIEGQSCALSLFNMVLNYTLSTKNIIKNRRLNKKAFDFVCGEIKTKFYQSIVRPGEMVGSIAAQSIGEPATQMTLNTFHLAGVSSANVTLGVPRLTEVVNIAKKLKTPSMTIFIKPQFIGDDEETKATNMIKIRGKIEHTSLINLLNLSEIYYDPDIKDTIIKEDQDMVNEFMEIKGDDIDERKENISPWLLRLEFNPTAMLNIKMESIEEIIKRKERRVLIIHTRESSDTKIFHIRLESINEDEESRSRTLSFFAIQEFEKQLISELSLGGIDSIKKVYVREINKTEFKESGEIDKRKKEMIIETDGTNLSKIFEVDEIDYKRTISNDINEIYEVLGIEAVRKALVQELRNVLKPYDIYVNYRHIAILCDLMTQKGFLTSITRHGLNRTDYGPIRKATFEETVEILLEAGIFSERDNLKGISENILLGKLTNVGTGNFDLLLDFEAFKSANHQENNDEIYQEELIISSPLIEDSTNVPQTPFAGETPNNLHGRSMGVSFSTYENNPNFTPGYNSNSISSPFLPYKGGDSSFIATPNANTNLQPSSPEYNPSSDYYKTPVPYSPIHDDNNRGSSDYVSSPYSPIRSPGQSGTIYTNYRRPLGQTATPRSTYSPTNSPGFRASSSSPQYVQGSGIYSTTPRVQDSGNSSQYTPGGAASPNCNPLSPQYNINRSIHLQNSPFYDPNYRSQNDKDDEEESDDDKQKNDEKSYDSEDK